MKTTFKNMRVIGRFIEKSGKGAQEVLSRQIFGSFELCGYKKELEKSVKTYNCDGYNVETVQVYTKKDNDGTIDDVVVVFKYYTWKTNGAEWEEGITYSIMDKSQTILF